MGLFSRIPVDKTQIEAAIVRLESQTSAELRVYIERKPPKQAQAPSAMARAWQVFEALNMQQTTARNGVLIYLGWQPHWCAIVGDEGIHRFVDNAFWQQKCDSIIADFQQKAYTQGIVRAIDDMATTLAVHFPVQPDDCNELDNEVLIHD